MEEFFQLFKTPWEYACPCKHYGVIITSEADVPCHEGLTILFSSAVTDFDGRHRISARSIPHPSTLDWQGKAVPIYGESAVFDCPKNAKALLTSEEGIAGFSVEAGAANVARIGYDLFEEVHLLLTTGQPAGQAMIPTLDRHIALVRSLILNSRQELLEVLPTPMGFDFTCCLTHDVDFLALRQHRLDRTLAGFLYRAICRTPIDLARGRRTSQDLWRNWRAAIELPLVLLGIIPDPWRPFEAYLRADGDKPLTFFVIPRRGYPGSEAPTSSSGNRGVSYEAADVSGEIQQVTHAGGEVGLHGIDAWCSLPAALQEKTQVEKAGGKAVAGVRMHWLYFEERSPDILSKSGFLYDSSVGYNDAVGFRSGTSQVHAFPQAEVLELPLHIQDTALFFSGRMGLGFPDAKRVCRHVIDRVKESRGVLTVNWHDRSLAPERLWDRFYRQFLDELQEYRVWFTTGTDAVAWFAQRRSVTFRMSRTCTGEEEVIVEFPGKFHPAAVLRWYRPAPENRSNYTDIPFDGTPISVSLTSTLHSLA